MKTRMNDVDTPGQGICHRSIRYPHTPCNTIGTLLAYGIAHHWHIPLAL